MLRQVLLLFDMLWSTFQEYSKVIYSLDFQVTPHQLRHTYITNLIYKGVDPKTVQYLAGHENSKITMDIYAKVKYNKLEELSSVVTDARSPVLQETIYLSYRNTKLGNCSNFRFFHYFEYIYHKNEVIHI